MQRLTAATGVQWVREGFATFGMRPMEFCTLFMSYVFLLLATSLIPLVGAILIALLLPVFNLAFLQASVLAEQGRRITPGALLTGFRSPQFRTLLRLGMLYLGVAILAAVIFLAIDDGTFRKIVERKLALNSPEVEASNLRFAMLAATASYILLNLPFWFAGPLILWQKMSLGKAVFYSFFAVLKSIKAFAIYGVIWLSLFGLARFIANGVFLVTNGNATIATLVWLPMSFILPTMVCCSFYATYVSVFGKPESAPETRAP